METEKKSATIVSALVDLGAAWAAHGLDAGKLSLETSARVLTKTAETLNTIAREFEKKSAAAEEPLKTE